MKDIKTDKKADMNAGDAPSESLGLMEPMTIAEGSRHREALNDLALLLAQESSAFKSSLPAGIATALADLVRAMNCYYSNLIEGHDTHPIDIERALKNDYSADPQKRNLQLEAEAHIKVQQWIDSGGLSLSPTAPEAICDIHKRFCENVPDELLWVEEPDGGERYRVEPGKLRDRHVKVGGHIAIHPNSVPRFLERFDQAYNNLGRTSAVLACGAAHHRLLWIHPFIDGNGRVARLMTHAMLLKTLDTGALWSVARGFARNQSAYKKHLAACDQNRRNDLDGRGTLSEEALAKFTEFFFETCLDQVRFMRELVAPDILRNRIRLWCKEEVELGKLPPKAERILEAILYRGELPRSEIAGLLDVTDRQARRITAELQKAEVLAADSPKAPFKLAFPARLASRWMPGLFPDKA